MTLLLVMTISAWIVHQRLIVSSHPVGALNAERVRYPLYALIIFPLSIRAVTDSTNYSRPHAGTLKQVLLIVNNA